MRRKGTNEQLAERRARGLALLGEGKTSKEVAEILEVSNRTVARPERRTRFGWIYSLNIVLPPS